MAFHRSGSLGPDPDFLEQLLLVEEFAVEAVIQIVAVVGNFVRQVGDLRLQRGLVMLTPTGAFDRFKRDPMLGQSFADFPTQIQARKPWVFSLQFLDDPEALSVVLEAAMVLHEPVEHGLAFVADGGVSEVVGQRDGLGQILIEAQGPGDVPADGRHFHGVGEPGAQVIA